MTIKLLTEQHLEFLSLKGGCEGPSESIHVKIPHCWKSHVAAHLFQPCDIPSSPLLAAFVNIAFSGNLGSPGMGKLEIPNVYISFWPAFFDVHCE